MFNQSNVQPIECSIYRMFNQSNVQPIVCSTNRMFNQSYVQPIECSTNVLMIKCSSDQMSSSYCSQFKIKSSLTRCQPRSFGTIFSESKGGLGPHRWTSGALAKAFAHSEVPKQALGLYYKEAWVLIFRPWFGI